MKIRERLKNFFSLRRKANGGFTLIELIVVIAVLAILGGVAVPAYTGYMKKANLAADQQLLAAVNKAFASACIEELVDFDYVNNSNAKLVIDTDTGVLDLDESTLVNDSVKAAFARYMGSDVGTKFKVVTTNDVIFNSTINMFEITDGGAYASLTFDPNLINQVKASAFYTAEGLGVENLMNKVENLTGLVAGLADQTGGTDGEGNGAWKMLAQYNTEMFEDLGIEFPTEEELGAMNEEEREAAMMAAMAPLQALVDDKIAVLDGQGIDGWDTMKPEDKDQYAQNVILSNYAVLNAAKGMKNQDAASVLSTIRSESNFKTMILNSEDNTGIAQASAAYGLFTAYAYTIEDAEAREAAIERANDPSKLLEAMDDEGFRSYLQTSQAEVDLAGYMATMEMISNSANDENAVRALMVNGFTDPALMAVVQKAMN